MLSILKKLFRPENKTKPVRYAPRAYRTNGPEKLLEKLRALDSGRGAWMRNAYLCSEFGVSDRTIRRWLGELKSDGLISVFGRGKGRRIHVIHPPASEPMIQLQRSMRRESDISSLQECRKIGREMSTNWPGNVRHNREIIIEQREKKKSVTKHNTRTPDEIQREREELRELFLSGLALRSEAANG